MTRTHKIAIWCLSTIGTVLIIWALGLAVTGTVDDTAGNYCGPVIGRQVGPDETCEDVISARQAHVLGVGVLGAALIILPWLEVGGTEARRAALKESERLAGGQGT